MTTGIFRIGDPPAAAESLPLCPTLCDLINGSPPGSTIPGSLQARTLEWCREPAREFPPMTRSCGRALMGKASQGSRAPLDLPEQQIGRAHV